MIRPIHVRGLVVTGSRFDRSKATLGRTRSTAGRVLHVPKNIGAVLMVHVSLGARGLTVDALSMKPAQREAISDREQGLQIFAEFRTLDRNRTRDGISPLEYQRWLDLRDTLLVKHGKLVETEGETRLCVDFRTEDHLMDSAIPQIATGGLFVGTPFAPDVGTDLILVIQVGSSERIEMPCTVVSNNVAEGFTTARLGMGVGFRDLDDRQRLWAERVGARKKDDGSGSG